jgi:hypothetical protein
VTQRRRLVAEAAGEAKVDPALLAMVLDLLLKLILECLLKDPNLTAGQVLKQTAQNTPFVFAVEFRRACRKVGMSWAEVDRLQPVIRRQVLSEPEPVLTRACRGN